MTLPETRDLAIIPISDNFVSFDLELSSRYLPNLLGFNEYDSMVDSRCWIEQTLL